MISIYMYIKYNIFIVYLFLFMTFWWHDIICVRGNCKYVQEIYYVYIYIYNDSNYNIKIII